MCNGQNLDDLAWTSDSAHLVYVSPHEALPQSSYTIWCVGLGGDRPRCIGTAVDERACSIGVATSDGGRVAIQVLEGLSSRLEWTDPASGERALLWTADGHIAAFGVRAGTWPPWSAPPRDLPRCAPGPISWRG